MPAVHYVFMPIMDPELWSSPLQKLGQCCAVLMLGYEQGDCNSFANTAVTIYCANIEVPVALLALEVLCAVCCIADCTRGMATTRP
jgi:hypothetical protein